VGLLDLEVILKTTRFSVDKTLQLPYSLYPLIDSSVIFVNEIYFAAAFAAIAPHAVMGNENCQNLLISDR
jgi:hypothetical protein